MKERCPFCHSDVDPKTVCKAPKPGAFGLVHFSPGICESTPQTRAAENARRAELAKAQAAAR